MEQIFLLRSTWFWCTTSVFELLYNWLYNIDMKARAEDITIPTLSDCPFGLPILACPPTLLLTQQNDENYLKDTVPSPLPL